MTTAIETHGACDSRFNAVKDAFAENFPAHGEVGAAVAVMVDGEIVVDLWAGHADAARTRSWERDTIVNVYSTTKGMTTICAHRLVDQGLLDVDAPVAKYWPEFAQAVAEGLNFPNGMVITPDEKTLIVAETMGRCLTAFDIAADGSLSGRRQFANLGVSAVGGVMPDGICLDAEGAVWVGSPLTSEFVRVKEGGAITHRIPVPGKWAVACMLGGEDRRTLFLCTAETTLQDLGQGKSVGWIETVRVEVAGAGLP